MFSFNPRYSQFKDKKLSFGNDSVTVCENDFIKEYFSNFINSCSIKKKGAVTFRFVTGIPETVVKRVEKSFGIQFICNEEAYIIDIKDDVFIYAQSQRGLFYGAVALTRYLEKNSFILEEGIIYDYPVCPIRGVKVYLPHRDDIDYFKHFVDKACYYRYNTIVIEVAGAMEYKRHPEINEKWVSYCKEMSEYSGKTKKIQEHTYRWKKNSIHVENGGGEFLTQDEVKDLVEYCKKRDMNVIPEMPSLSHSDYLLTAYPELRERVEDPYPDTYCPSNPDSYKLLFELLDEVIEVFRPQQINMGHDEYYSIGLCEKCKNKEAHRIFADDINKIYDYLKEHGVEMIIWGDKLLNAKNINGNTGGAKRTVRSYDTGEYYCTIPATYKAIEMIPKDISVFHWYWAMNSDLEQDLLRHNFNVAYGNFVGYAFPNWKERIKRGMGGAIISNWSRLKEENLQRNGFLFNMVYSSIMFWQPEYDDSQFEAVRDYALTELYKYKNTNKLKRNNCLKISHSTDLFMQYQIFEDGVFIEKEKYFIGQYLICYNNGAVEKIPIIYGSNISNKDVKWDRHMSDRRERYSVDDLLIEVSMNTLPIKLSNGTFYEFVWESSYPVKDISKIEVEVFCDCIINIGKIEFVC